MKTLRLREVDGFRLPPTFDPDMFRAACKYRPSADQIVVATFPKCGTTWTLQIVMLILRKGVPPVDAKEYFSLLPFMEIKPVNVLQNLRKDGCIKTHLPFDRINFARNAKYVYVARHPADCAVSFYHHVQYFPVYFFSDASFDEFFEIFITGQNDFNDYFDNLLSWYEHRNEPNVLFITFESLKADPSGTILKIAKFLGEEHHQCLVADNGSVLKKVLEYSSVDYMKDTVDKYYAGVFSQVPPLEIQENDPVIKNYADIYTEAINAGHRSIGHFVRKGGIGEGKIILSEDQKRRLADRIKEKCANSDVMELWENHK